MLSIDFSSIIGRLQWHLSGCQQHAAIDAVASRSTPLGSPEHPSQPLQRPTEHCNRSPDEPQSSTLNPHRSRGAPRLAGWLGWLVGWLAGWLVCWLVGCLAGWLVGWLVGWFPSWLDGWLGWLVGWLVGWFVGWLAGWLAGWLVVRLVGWVAGDSTASHRLSAACRQ